MANYAHQRTAVIYRKDIEAIYSDNANNKGELFLHSLTWKYIQNTKKVLSEAGFTV